MSSSIVIDSVNISSLYIEESTDRFKGIRIITFDDLTYNFPTFGNIEPDIKLKNRNIQLIYLNYLKTVSPALKARIENISKSLMSDHNQDYDYNADFFGGEEVSDGTEEEYYSSDSSDYEYEPCFHDKFYKKVKAFPLGPHEMPFVVPVQSDTCGGAGAGVEPKYNIYDFAAHRDKDGYSEVDVHTYSKVFEDAYSEDIELSVPALSYLSDCSGNAGYARTYFEKYINRFADLSTSTGRYNYYISGKNKPKTFRNIYMLINEARECCEWFGVKFSDPLNIINEKIKKISHSNESFKGEDIYYDKCVIEVLFESGVTAKIDIYNDHNGYYPHDYFMSFNDYYDTSTI